MIKTNITFETAMALRDKVRDEWPEHMQHDFLFRVGLMASHNGSKNPMDLLLHVSAQNIVDAVEAIKISPTYKDWKF